MRLKFDELHKFEVDYDYFEPMQISSNDKERRRELADFLADAFLFLFATLEVHRTHNSLLPKEDYKQMLAEKIADEVTKVTGVDSYLSGHIKDLASDVVDTTFKHIDKDKSEGIHSLGKNRKAEASNADITPQNPPDTPSPSGGHSISTQTADTDSGSDNDYWLSFRRAEDIGKTEANTFLNYTDYVNAKERGAKKKTWLTMLDNKVRNTHEEVEGLTIGIDESFTVGNSLMKFPHDLSQSPDPKEVINCRCAVDYR